MTGHDVALDYIVTPQEVIATEQRYGQPAGIYWDELPPEKLAAIPVLRQQARLAEGEAPVPSVWEGTSRALMGTYPALDEAWAVVEELAGRLFRGEEGRQ